MPADQTVPDSVYRAAATASVRTEGVNDGYIEDTLRMPEFRAGVDAAYAAGVAAGRAQAAADLAETFKRIADSTRQSLVSTPPEFATEQHTHRVRARAFERAAEIAKGSP
jgi:hypothetical protein